MVELDFVHGCKMMSGCVTIVVGTLIAEQACEYIGKHPNVRPLPENAIGFMFGCGVMAIMIGSIALSRVYHN
jgi:hypothetical protein